MRLHPRSSTRSPRVRALGRILPSVLCVLAATSATADGLRLASEAFTEPYERIEVSASEPGRVFKVHVRRGTHVKADALLMELDATVLEAERRVAAQRIEATARIEALQVDFQQKQRRYEAIASLRRDGAVSPEELLSSESETRIAELQVRAANEELDRLRLELAEIEARIEQRRVRAPIAGVVVDVRREAGEFVSASEPDVVTLVDLSRLRATFYLPTADILELVEGESVTLQPSGDVVTGLGHVVAATIEHIAPLTQADSGRVRVDVVIDNRDGRQRSGLRYTLSAGRTSAVANGAVP